MRTAGAWAKEDYAIPLSTGHNAIRHKMVIVQRRYAENGCQTGMIQDIRKGW